jgi:hypothetical protein
MQITCVTQNSSGCAMTRTLVRWYAKHSRKPNLTITCNPLRAHTQRERFDFGMSAFALASAGAITLTSKLPKSVSCLSYR